MESRLIFESNKTYLNNVIWIFSKSDSEWNFINNENIYENEIRKIIEENFSEDNLYFVLNRNDSKEINKTEIPKNVLAIYKDENFTIWNKTFQKVIEFNKNGVFRIGTSASS